MIDALVLSDALTERFGLPVSATSQLETDGLHITIKPTSIPQTISFQVKLILGWRTIKARFSPGNYASSLLRSIKTATADQKSAFSVFAKSLKRRGADVVVEFDSVRVDETVPESWPNNWSSINIGMKKLGIVVENQSGYDFAEVFPWTTGFFGMTLAMLPLEPEEDRLAGVMEGSVTYKTVKSYERSRINRAACIEIHGTSCLACGMSFGAYYGRIAEGFIHVHHITPVSSLGGAYVINPGTDLVPLCPNCHAVVHRRNPPFTVAEIKTLLFENGR